MSPSQTVITPAADPPRYKLALITWVGAYATITLILDVLGPTMAPWPLPLRTLLLSVLMVAALTWLVIPLLSRACRGWLSSNSAPRSSARSGLAKTTTEKST